MRTFVGRWGRRIRSVLCREYVTPLVTARPHTSFTAEKEGKLPEKTYELQHGLIYVYVNGQLSRIAHNDKSNRENLAKLGYVQRNKFERERNT